MSLFSATCGATEFNKHKKPVCVTNNKKIVVKCLYAEEFIWFSFGAPHFALEMGRRSTCWSVGRQPGVRELLLKHLREKAGLPICQDISNSSFCQANLRSGVPENYATKDSKIGIQKDQLFSRQFRTSSLPLFPGVEADGHQSQPRDWERSLVESEPRGKFQQTCLLCQSHWCNVRQLLRAQLSAVEK